MVKEKKYIITRSNYTLKKKHKQFGNDSTIYERDFMITNNGQTWSGDGSAYGTSSFKMVNKPKNGGSYKYNTGGWLPQTKCTDETHDYGDKWTLNCIPNKDKENSENNIHINPNLTSLLSFAYYGSTKDLIKNSINNIIENFPAEIIFTAYEDEKGRYEIENPFLIDLYTVINNKDEDDNLRLFIQNCEKYHILKYNERAGKEISIPVEYCEFEDIIKEKCAKEGDLLHITKIYFKTETAKNYTAALEIAKKLTSGQLIRITSDEIYDGEVFSKGLYIVETNGSISPTSADADYIDVKCYYEDKKRVYYTTKYYGLRIRPNDEYVNKFFESLDVFQSNILNRWTTPKYKMQLDFPHETEKGIETYKKYFIWPLKYTLISKDRSIDYELWNIDIDTYEYESYLNGLLELCNFYDERCTNNLWRSLTHDSIKNMDYAFKDEKIEDDEYSLGEGRFEEIIKCFAHQFDDIKKYIDNIKTNNTITYGNDSNIPSYFLSDKLENSGWEVSNLANVLDENVKINNYSVSDININMMKHLQINSKQILAHKGTRHGINMLLGLFGLKSYDVDKNSYDYKLTEYVDVVKSDENIDYDTVVSFNNKKKNFYETYSDFEGDTTNPLQGLPVKAVSYIDGDGNNKFYLIPWFDKDETLDGNVYYQMYGGWGKSFTKELANTRNISDDIASTENIPIYNETIKNLIAVQTIDDLKYISYNKKHQNCVAYVYNIGDFGSKYKNDGITNITLSGGENNEKATNYFILHTATNSYTIGSEKNGDNINYGWVNVTEKDLEKNTDNGIRVKLLESVIENHKGNNPHGGFAKYDDGETYIDYFRKIFKYSLENDNFNDLMYTCENGLLNPEVEKMGFNIEKQKDNVKTWYFTDTSNQNENNKLLELTIMEDINEASDFTYKGVKYKNIKNINYFYDKKPQENVNVGFDANNYTFFESDVQPYNFENGEAYDEVAANSIINNKRLLIEFSNGLMDNSVFPRFLQECILPYLTQIIPSTTIWEVRLEGDNAVYTEQKVEVETIDE